VTFFPGSLKSLLQILEQGEVKGTRVPPRVAAERNAVANMLLEVVERMIARCVEFIGDVINRVDPVKHLGNLQAATELLNFVGVNRIIWMSWQQGMVPFPP
jgi:hypothetical protein